MREDMFNADLAPLCFDCPVGDYMKGVIAPDGNVVSWPTKGSGTPHHEEVDRHGYGVMKLANYASGPANEISILGDMPGPIRSIDDILGCFDDYKGATHIVVRIRWEPESITFRFHGTVAQLKAFFRHYPPPDQSDCDPLEFDEIYRQWTKMVGAPQRKSVRELLGRGGRNDVWQEKDEDWSESFSVYNNPPKKRRRK